MLQYPGNRARLSAHHTSTQSSRRRYESPQPSKDIKSVLSESDDIQAAGDYHHSSEHQCQTARRISDADGPLGNVMNL